MKFEEREIEDVLLGLISGHLCGAKVIVCRYMYHVPNAGYDGGPQSPPWRLLEVPYLHEKKKKPRR